MTDTQLQELQGQYANDMELLLERIAALELSLEDTGWQRLIGETQQEFSRAGLATICELSRIMFLKNPLIQRGVKVTGYYVFGQSVTVAASDPDVDAVLQRFWKDVNNRAELTTQQALTGKEHELEITGNLFFALFTNKATGRVQVRTIPVDEISEIICNPEDRKDPWYYKRSWQQQTLDLQSGVQASTAKTAYYPDWHYNPKAKPKSIGSNPVVWDTPVFHIKVGGTTDMAFGVPEYYAAIDWARAYKEFLEDWATIVRAYSRFAWQATVKGGSKGIAAAKTKLGTTVGANSNETNPPAVTGSTLIAGEGVSMTPIRTAGATTSADDGRRLLLMVAAVFGLPETFFGDVSVGTLATSKSLDRPTELKMKDRQTLWSDTLVDMAEYVVEQAAKAASGPLTSKVTLDTEEDGTTWISLIDKTPVTISCTFPPLLEHDIQATITAITQAATMGGSPLAGTLSTDTLIRQICQALGIKDVQAEIDAIAEEAQNEIDNAPADTGMAEAAHNLLEAIKVLKESYAPRS